MRLLFATLLCCAADAALAEPAVVLSSETAGNRVTITASAKSDKAFEGALVLEIHRTGQSGVLTSRQSSKVSLPDGGEIVAARSGFSFDEGGESKIVASLFRDPDILVSTSELNFKSPE